MYYLLAWLSSPKNCLIDALLLYINRVKKSQKSPSHNTHAYILSHLRILLQHIICTITHKNRASQTTRWNVFNYHKKKKKT